MPSVRGMDRSTVRVDSTGMKYCSGCQTRKELTDFHVRSASPDGRHGFCKQCRKEGRKLVPIVDPEGFKTCSECKVQKPVSEFHPARSSRTSDGLQSHCKPCNSYSRRRRGYKLIAKYGITLEQYQELLDKQDGRCAVCGTDKPWPDSSRTNFVVDHCHSTGRVRGLLCATCNLMLGYAKDQTEILRAAITYLAA